MNKFLLFLCTAVLVLGFASSALAGPDLRPTKPKPAPTPVPEPLTMALLGGGLVGLYGLKKKLGKDDKD